MRARLLRRLTHTTADVRGSIALALLLVLFVTSVILVLALESAQAQRGTVRDRSYTLAIHNADAGVQAAVYTLNRRTREAAYGGTLSDPHSGATSTGPWTWTAALAADGRTWRVTSTGTYAGRSRTVLADVRNSVRFAHALLTDRATRLVGNNSFDTYRSPSQPPALAPNEATLASNGTIKAIAGSTSAGGVVLYNTLEEAAPQRCTGQPAICGAPQTLPHPAPLTSDDDLRFITSATAACKAAAGVSTLPDWIASRDAVVSGGVAYFSPGGPGPYCFRNLVFDRSTQFSPAPGTSAVVYLEGTMTVSARTTVNIGAGEVAPVSSRLQVYTAAAGTLDWDTGARFAGGVYAPRASCGEKTSAGTEIYGALVCGSFDVRGGLRFHYDLSLRSETTSSYAVTAWQER